MGKLLLIHPGDTAAVALEEIKEQEIVISDGCKVRALERIAPGHKIALEDIEKGEYVIKYGLPIGRAGRRIPMGGCVQNEDIVGGSGVFSFHGEGASRSQQVSAAHKNTFHGYRRRNSRVGIRNEIWILSLAGCVNCVVRELEKRAQGLKRGSIDGIFGLTHDYGCSQTGEDLKRMERMLVRIAKHGNAGGILAVGLGCSNIPIEKYRELMGDDWDGRIKFLDCQSTGDEITEGLKLLEELCVSAASDAREPIPVSELIIGVKCGASDSYSPLTGNPLIGMVSNYLVKQGGSVILTELSELLGAENHLAGRCADRSVYEKLEKMINEEIRLRERYGVNTKVQLTKADEQKGYATVEEKLLGFLQKGGTGPIQDVIFYGYGLKKHGLNLLQSQGYDMVAATALAAAGAHILLFSTGRGTPFGALVPTLKIANTTDLYRRKEGWMDFNAGRRLEGENLEALAQELYRKILSAASGIEQTKHEKHAGREITLFKDGMTY